ncbi:HlyD family type I secretion periplasmic adaptor subunit [Maritalea porphyrae]|uniref:HlyD family type I secretion periplasmic adaptor subunit n=1 Tax=Maritalea porphyrae TaxID=880732 RepID=UPI0022B03542|nr:HlyD family type I secretion periplasmic adaptor subunit [Maritalea porphyrae]MCZ4271946.1 HlyD family type I secretion periplasmic adaptor subunit [Maritalea porphyrae]
MTSSDNKKVRTSPRAFVLIGYVVILLTFGALGGWAAFAKIDSAVIASGTIAVESNRKAIQHLEGGIVEEILVKEAERVVEGQVLVRLNSVQARSTLEVLQNRLRIALASEARLQAERHLKSEIDFSSIADSMDDPHVSASVNDQVDIFNDRFSILNSQIKILNGRIEQLHKEIDGLNIQKEAFVERVDILSKQLERLRDGVAKEIVPENILAAREEEFVSVKANVGKIETELAKVGKSIGETELQIIQTEQQYKERANAEFKEVNSQIQELQENLKVAVEVVDRLEIRAPVSGSVQNIKVHTAGGVVRSGEKMMEIVPVNDQLVINARVSPIDIDNVSPGLRTEVRFVAFQSRFMPIVLGTVESVSRDVIVPEDGSTQPYFLARIDVVEDMVPIEVQGRLRAGMPADVIITTGERTVIDYLVAPMADAIAKSMREE